MRLCFGLALATLLTGAAYGIIRTVEVTEGDSFTFSVVTFMSTVERCYLKTPSGQVIDFAPGDESASTDKYVVEQGNVMSACILTLHNADKNDDGSWDMYFTSGTETSSVQEYVITVILKDVPEQHDESDEGFEDENVTLMSAVKHFTKQYATIDVSLSKEAFEEECFIRPPNGQTVSTDNFVLNGVTVQSKSNYVSCRVTIGPMSEELLGTWRLCGKSALNGEIRCQPVDIAWYSNNGMSNWQSVTQFTSQQPVHYGGTVYTGAAGSGSVTTCHVITPAGEDLVISSDSKYPHIEMVDTDQVLCGVFFRDITEDMLGTWVVMGRFNTILGQQETRQPLNFFLYNEENPHEQAYNVTKLQDEQHLVNFGNELTLEVSQKAGVVKDCIFKKPTGMEYDLSNYQQSTLEGVSFKISDTEAVCQIVFSSITEEAIGVWLIAGKFNNGLLFDERIQSFELIKEDPEDPIVDEVDREITTMDEQIIYTEMDTTHRVVISTETFTENESCHLITPTGAQYAFIAGFNVPGVEIIQESGVECGVQLNVKESDMIGTWMLIARATRLSSPIERRLPFTIRVEENFVIQNPINITEGADLYLHLNYGVTVADTCKLYGPGGEEYTDAEADALYPDNCGFIVRNVGDRHTGEWIIEYGSGVKYRGSVTVNVLESQTITIDPLQWIVSDSVDIILGPEDAVYCKIEDPYKHTVYDSFGQCKIVLDRVNLDHRGLWHMYVGLPGSVMLRTFEFTVSVLERDSTPMVTTAVERNAPSVMMSCSVPAEHEVKSCTFRTPDGNTVVAAHGVGEDGYMFNGSFVSHYQSEAHTNDCTLRLVNPTVADLGIWRCGLLTTTGTYYGFLTVVCPHLMQDPEVAASIVTEPVLSAVNEVSYEEEEPAVLSCSIPTELRYCYFRARNGSIFNVFPSMSSSLDFEYVGAGLDAGDCGIRFKNGLAYSEGGAWSCHVGLSDTNAEEQRTTINVDVRARMLVNQYWLQSKLMVSATVYNPYTIDYCRFVRIDGHGFTTDHIPDTYELEQSLTSGHCTLVIRNPTILDLHPWTIAVKFIGLPGEVVMTTTENVFAPATEPKNVIGEIIFWMFILLTCLLPAMAASALIPKKNREWTYNRANGMRNSFRDSWRRTFRKEIITEEEKEKGQIKV